MVSYSKTKKINVVDINKTVDMKFHYYVAILILIKIPL